MSKKMKLKMSARLMKKRIRKRGGGSKKQCRFVANPELQSALDYKNADFLRGFLTERGKILPARISGNSAFWQRRLTTEIKKARAMALLPYTTGQY